MAQKKAKPKTITSVTFTKLRIPAKWVYEYFSHVAEEKKLAVGTNVEFQACIRDDKVVLAKNGCEETFIFDKAVVKELAALCD